MLGSAGGQIRTRGRRFPVLLSAVIIVQSLLQPDYSHLALPVRALAAWPTGWIQNLDFTYLACS